MNALTTLAERCESAGADEQRALLEEAWHVIHGEPNGVASSDPRLGHWLRFCILLNAYAYVDAALMFVPEGMTTYLAVQNKDTGAWTWQLRCKTPLLKHGVKASTPALAILSASLRAWADRSE